MDTDSEKVKFRLTLLMLMFMAASAALLGRSVFVQLIPDERLDQLARKQFNSKVLIKPRRGSVLDTNGEPLAVNVEINSLAANPLKVQNKKTAAWLLSKAVEIPASKLIPRFSEKKEFVWIKRHLSEADMAKLRRWHIMDKDGSLISGLWLVKESQRAYPHAELAAHVIGDVNVDSEGIEGVELREDERLRGKVAAVTAIKDALGRPTFIDAAAAKHVKEGEKISLTIDASLQFAVEVELRGAIRKTGSKSGTVIIMDSATGEILALANEPSFNPNEKGAPADYRRNRAITDGYEPGSTLKAVLLAAALSNGWKLNDKIWAESGKIRIQGKVISEAESREKFGWLDIKEVLQVSSNVGAAKLALKVGADHYHDMLRAFGFGSKTNIRLPGEISGRIPHRKSWPPLTLANIGFGQGIMVTRLQMLRAYAAILNGGWLVRPRIINGEEDVDVRKRIISQKVSAQLLDALEAVTGKNGTGTKAMLEGYRVAGKTGTAQMVDSQTGTYSRSRFISSFIGFALGVEPKIAIFVSLDEPKGVYYASDTAAPLFREILNVVATRFSMPSKGVSIGAEKLAVKSAEKTEKQVIRPSSLKWRGATSTGRFTWTMPSLSGLTPREVIDLLKGHEFGLEFKGDGVVHEQFPAEGKLLAEGDKIKIVLAEP
ncbi:MAG: penicillin-binding protein [Bdellovibrionota bacterium]